MVSPILYEGRHAGGFMISEDPGTRSRSEEQITNGGSVPVLYQAGLVLTKAVLGTPTTAHGTNTGTGTIGSVSIGQGAIQGAYSLVAVSATSFNLFDPNGVELGPVPVGSAVSKNEINFTITAGGTAFVAGDTFTITVPAGGGLVSPYTSTTASSGGNAYGLLYNEQWVNPGATVNVTVIKRGAEVNLSELVWDSSITGSGSMAALEAAAVAQLNALGIITR